MNATENSPDLQIEIDKRLDEAYQARVHDLPNSILLTEKILEESRRHKYADGSAKALNHLGLFYLIQGEFEKALTLSKEALTHFEFRDNKQGIAGAKYNIGSVYYRTDNYHLGLQYMLESLVLFRALEDYHNQARTLKSIGTIYEYFNNYESAIESYRQCIEISQKGNDLNSESNAYNPLSGIYLKRGEIELARTTIEKSIAIKKKTNDRRGLAFALYGRGKVFLKVNEPENALKDFLESLEIQLASGDKLGTGMVENKLGLTYLMLGDTQKAKDHFLQALHLAETYNVRFIRFTAYHHLYELARKRGDAEEALDYLEKYISFKESVVNTESLNIIKSYETRAKIQELEHEAQLQREKAEIIENKNAELDSFFYRVSHDLKGPISSLLGLHNLVEIDITDDVALRYFEMYHRQIQRLNNIVLGLINLTQMKHLGIIKVKIDFESLVEECIQAYSYLPKFGDLEFRKKIQPSIEFYSEWAIVNTIIQNLIENAIKYARHEAPSFVRIAIYTVQNHLIISVQDNGLGIHPDHQSKIFDMFYRASERAKGSGLGLYILKRAVERLNGKIDLKSELNIGSTFTVTLPFEAKITT